MSTDESIEEYKARIAREAKKRKRANIRERLKCYRKRQEALEASDAEIEAAKAYDIKAKELFGEFAYLNFKKCA